MNNLEQRIRELAYQIWESEGRPDGENERHWQMATRLVQGEQQGDLQPRVGESPRAAKVPPAKSASTRKPRSKTGTPANDETQLEKPALLGKPAGAAKPARARRQPVTRTTKVRELGKPDSESGD